MKRLNLFRFSLTYLQILRHPTLISLRKVTNKQPQWSHVSPESIPSPDYQETKGEQLWECLTLLYIPPSQSQHKLTAHTSECSSVYQMLSWSESGRNLWAATTGLFLFYKRKNSVGPSQRCTVHILLLLVLFAMQSIFAKMWC